MKQQSSPSIPRPLVRTNQWFIVLSVILTWVSGVVWILAFPLCAGILGLAFGCNPVMRFAKLFLTKKPSEYIPEDRSQQQFNQIIAVACLALGLVGYLFGWTVMAYIFTTMVALAAFIAILGFCVGCFIRYQWLQLRYRMSLRRS
jgi:ABC-type antimicrobial peptide transport system permease subunit